MAFVDAFEIVYTIKNDLKIDFGYDIPFTMMKNRLSLFGVFT